MAIYHLSMRNITRNSGKSFFSYIAYVTGEKLRDPESGKVYNRTSKDEVEEKGTVICKNAPEEWKDKEKLWAAVLQEEKRTNSRLAKDFNVALPLELSHEQNVICLQELADQLAENGMCVTWALHNKDGNPHGHLVATCRPILEDGSWGARQKAGYKLDENGNRIPMIDKETGLQKRGKKGDLQWKRETTPVGSFDQKDFLERIRTSWENIVNEKLPGGIKIDHRSYARQGIDRTPTIHLGKGAHVVDSDRKATNDQIIALNLQDEKLKAELNAIEQQRAIEERKTALEEMKKVVKDYQDEGFTLEQMKAHNFDFYTLDPKGLIGIYKANKGTIDRYNSTLPSDKQQQTDAKKTLVVFKKAVGELIKEKPQAELKDFTAAPPKKMHNTHTRHRKHHTPPPLINGKKLAHEIDYQSQKEKNDALRDYEQAQRAADQERWRMQHRDDWDMD